jgi:hypothetical protein
VRDEEEQMPPKVVAQGARVPKPKTAYRLGEAPQLNLPGNRYA